MMRGYLQRHIHISTDRNRFFGRRRRRPNYHTLAFHELHNLGMLAYHGHDSMALHQSSGCIQENMSLGGLVLVGTLEAV